jgi:hypothetical protein
VRGRGGGRTVGSGVGAFHPANRGVRPERRHH